LSKKVAENMKLSFNTNQRVWFRIAILKEMAVALCFNASTVGDDAINLYVLHSYSNIVKLRNSSSSKSKWLSLRMTQRLTESEIR